jgi:putative Mg2+ transporter-C (MgtC) family protein
MNAMPVHIGWEEVAIRLALTLIAGILIGYNRTEHGKAAGLRTTLLVCAAASIAMIQVNLLLPTAGRSPGSFVMNDLMRLPLGILTGVGFIGAGAIIQRENLVVGVTTAATMWFVTVVGLCFGGGQIGLGALATVIGLFALWVLDWVETRLRRDHRATLRIEFESGNLSEEKIRAKLENAGLRIVGTKIMLLGRDRGQEITFDLREFRLPSQTRSPPICQELAREEGVAKLSWSAPS